jgi:hypothetical protein
MMLLTAGLAKSHKSSLCSPTGETAACFRGGCGTSGVGEGTPTRVGVGVGVGVGGLLLGCAHASTAAVGHTNTHVKVVECF